jgi:hypothetical protein
MSDWDFDDDADWDRWMELSDEEQEREVDISMHRHMEWWNSMTPLEQYRHSRRSAVEGCLKWRKDILPKMPFLVYMLKERQMTMVKLRHWHRTGIYPGEA